MSRPLSIILVVSTNPPVLRSKSEMPFADNSLSANKTGHSWICVYLDPPCVTQSFSAVPIFWGCLEGLATEPLCLRSLRADQKILSTVEFFSD